MFTVNCKSIWQLSYFADAYLNEIYNQLIKSYVAFYSTQVYLVILISVPKLD